MVIRPLAASDFDAVLVAFNAAFSDYVVPLTLTREQLAEMLRRRGWIPEVSIAAFEDDRIVALTLNAIEETRAYDTGTGVVPTHRRHGLGRAMMLRSIDLLRARGCTSYVLEVIETNEKAVGLYRALGFRETRGLQCWRVEIGRTAPQAVPDSLRGCPTFQTWCDVAPSWQNSASSVARAADLRLTLSDDDGYAILFPATGDLAQFAVRPEARRRGVGTRLLRAAAEHSTQPLRIMNVDDRDAGIARFLEAVGAKRTVRQLEMVLAI